MISVIGAKKNRAVYKNLSRSRSCHSEQYEIWESINEKMVQTAWLLY